MLGMNHETHETHEKNEIWEYLNHETHETREKNEIWEYLNHEWTRMDTNGHEKVIGWGKPSLS